MISEMKAWRSFLNEKVYGGLATVYHRTKSTKNIGSILRKGFKPGYGDMYNGGLYTVYEFDPAHSVANDIYGKIVIKFKINLANKFLIFDYDQASKVYGAGADMRKQFELLDISENRRFVQGIKVGASCRVKWHNWYDKSFDLAYMVTGIQNKVYFLTSDDGDKIKIEFYTRAPPSVTIQGSSLMVPVNVVGPSGHSLYGNEVELIAAPNAFNIVQHKTESFEKFFDKVDKAQSHYTSDTALWLSHREDIIGQINGMVFTGRRDGKVCVIYNPDAATMLSWGEIEPTAGQSDAEVIDRFWSDRKTSQFYWDQRLIDASRPEAHKDIVISLFGVGKKTPNVYGADVQAFKEAKTFTAELQQSPRYLIALAPEERRPILKKYLSDHVIDDMTDFSVLAYDLEEARYFVNNNTNLGDHIQKTIDNLNKRKTLVRWHKDIGGGRVLPKSNIQRGLKHSIPQS